MSDRNVAVVTGGSGGIGNALCKCLISESYRVYIWSRDPERGTRVVDALNQLNLPGKAIYQNCDVRSEASIGEAVRGLSQKEDQVNLLVNGAGILRRIPVEKTDSKTASDQINTMLLGTMLATSAMVPLLSAAGNGNVINISSVAGRHSYPGLAVYGAVKAGIIHFTRTSARELLARGIRVNCICPGIVDTPLQSAAELLWLKSVSPRNRIQKPEEIAEFIFQILRFPSMTGSVIDLDDGVGLFSGAAVQTGKTESPPPASIPDEKISEPIAQDETTQTLSVVFSRVFGINSNQIHAHSGPDDIIRWDSVGHLRLISDLEGTFGRQFSIDEVMQMTDFSAILRILKK